MLADALDKGAGWCGHILPRRTLEARAKHLNWSVITSASAETVRANTIRPDLI
ncbi:hypothetical protein PbDSM24746_56780 [Paenibacillus macerans]|nr:hypothetical protein PbDSM24746_56780 [Paenibacillus macerans]GBK71901.1 hypothetical protein PbJCM17693_56090 [Paenibacillus macerans]GIP12824.1 hypothetical protein J1TS5_49940 [Paenibacillus macerans]